MDTKTEEFIKKARARHGDRYDYSRVEYKKNNRIKVLIGCPIHGLYNQSPVDHLRTKGCPKCSNRIRLTTEEFIERARKIHGNQYDYSLVVYDKSQTPVKIICRFHNIIFNQRPNDHLSGGQGCLKCGKLRTANFFKMTLDDFINKATRVHGHRYCYDHVTYVNNHTPVKIVCQRHNIFYQTPNAHLAGKGCRSCMKKNYSKIQIQWLEYVAKTQGIYIQHAENEGEFSIARYRMDGYCAETNTCYEFNGDLYHGNPDVHDPEYIHPLNGRKMKDLYASTLKKEKAIKDAGYNLVTMWEADWNKIIKATKVIQRWWKGLISQGLSRGLQA